MDLSSIFQLCSVTVARQIGQKRRRRAAICRRLGSESLEPRLMMDAQTDYQNALAAAQSAYAATQASEDGIWQSAWQSAQDNLTSQLDGLTADENAFDQSQQQDITNTINSATTTEQNAETAADQQASSNDQTADGLAQQQIQDAQSTEASQDATAQSQSDSVVGPAATQLSAAETADQNTFDSTMGADQAQHDSDVSAALAAVRSTEASDSNDASQNDTNIQNGLQSQLNNEATARDAQIDGATPSVDPSVAADDPSFQGAVTDASNKFNTKVSNAEDQYNTDVSNAASTQQSQIDGPGGAAAQLAIDEHTAQSQYAIAQQDAQNDYKVAMIPIQGDLDTALTDDQNDYNTAVGNATTTYNSDLQTAATTQASSQQDADDAYNLVAQPLLDGYNLWLTNRTRQYNTDLGNLQTTLDGEISTEETNYATKVAGYATNEQGQIQSAIDGYNSAVAGFASQQATSDEPAWNTYNGSVANAQGTLDDAQNNYNETVNNIYETAEENGTAPDQSALDQAWATLDAANHAFSNATAAAAVVLQAALGVDEQTFATSEGPAYVTEQDGIATAQGTYDTQAAGAEHVKDDNEAQDTADADAQSANLAATFDNDVETHYETLQLQLAPLIKTREDAYADAAQQYQDDCLTAWAKDQNAVADATQIQTKADTDAYAAFDLASDGPRQTLQEKLAGADAALADALAKANGNYNARLMAADIQYDEAIVAAQVASETASEGATNDYIAEVAPAWAAAIIAASGNDSGTTIWANAWSAYMIAVVGDAENAQAQEDSIFQSTEDEMIELGTGLSAQVSALDQKLADQAGAAEVEQITDDTTAILAADAVAVPAQATLVKTEIDDARAEITAEINADKQDGDAHATNEDVRDKAYSSARLAFLQQADPVIATDDEAERTKAASDTGQAVQDEADATKKVDAATEQEVDDLVPAGQTMVDKEAKADKTFVKAEVDAAVDAANDQAANTAADVAAEPDTDFTAGQTIGVPGIYINIYGFHAEFTLPLISDGQVMGYKNFWFGLEKMPAWWDLRAPLGMLEGKIIMTDLPASFDPEGENDFFVPTTFDGYMKMLQYAMKMYREQGLNYSIVIGQHCVGFTVDTMDQAGIFPKYDPMFWTTGWELGVQLNGMANLSDLFGVSPGSEPVELPGSNWSPPMHEPRWPWE